MSKKIYSVPDIQFEDFSLSTNIAAGCEEEPFGNTETCGVKWSKVAILFASGAPIDNCNVKIVEGDPNYNGLCYHNPTLENNVFFS